MHLTALGDSGSFSLSFLFMLLRNRIQVTHSIVCCVQTGRQQPNRAEIVVTVTMTNYIKRREAMGSGRNNHFCLLVIADADNKVVFKQRLG